MGGTIPMPATPPASTVPTETTTQAKSPGTGATPPKRGLSGAAIAGIAAVVIVIVVLGVIAAGLIPGVSFSSGSSRSSSPPPVTESSPQALAIASPTAKANGAGTLYAVVGLSSTTTFTFGKEQYIGNVSCPVVAGLSNNITVSPSTGNYSSGSLPGWLFVYYNSTTAWATWIGVFGGQSEYFGYFSGGSCMGALPLLEPLPGSYLNSTAAATAALSVAGSFIAGHPQASVEYALTPSNFSHSPPVWHLDYTTCGVGPNSGRGSGDSFNVYLNAEDGVVLSNSTSTGQSCSESLAPAPPPLGPIGAAGIDGIATGVLGGTLYYAELSLDPTSGLVTSTFGLSVTNSSTEVTLPSSAIPSTCLPGDPAIIIVIGDCHAPASGWYAVLANSTSVIVSCFGAANGNWTTAVTISAADTLYIVSASPVAGQMVLTPYTFGSVLVLGGFAL